MKQHVSNKVAWMVVALLIPQVALAGGFVNRTKEFTGEDEIGETSASFGDLNGDGYVDLSTALSLFVNVQGKSYKRIGMGVTLIWGDVNNDGHLDYVTVPGSGALMLGDGKGGFQLGVRPPGPFGAECIAASFGDINNDGLLDIYYGGGSGSQDTLWRQAPEREEKWVRVIEEGGAYCRSVVACDFDEDNDIDFYASNYWLTPNWLWVSDGKGAVVNRAADLGAQGGSGHSIGACWGDVDNDGYFDLFAGNFAHSGQPESRFLRNTGPKNGYKFEDKGPAGVGYQESYASPTLGDYDNDGDLDLFFTTVYGHNAARLYRNDGLWKFVDVTQEEGLQHLGATYQAAWADVDNDGDLDLATNGKLFINQGNNNHWLKIRLQGDGKTVNRSAIGSRVRIQLGDQTLSRQVEGGGVGQGNQNDLTLHFGLGEYTGDITYTVTWTNGSRQQGVTPVDRTIDIKME
ncbi:MAG: VCBS repeat-containing protein [Pirellulaceae bacterium]|nr:VCBS repeat-containing protein [Pirellulaceae bacterium]